MRFGDEPSKAANGTWTPGTDIFSQVGPRKSVLEASCTGLNGTLHVAFNENGGSQGLWYTSRNANGTWTSLSNLSASAGIVGQVWNPALSSQSATGTLQLMFTGSDGRQRFVRRSSSGVWSGLQLASTAGNDPHAYDITLE